MVHPVQHIKSSKNKAWTFENMLTLRWRFHFETWSVRHPTRNIGTKWWGIYYFVTNIAFNSNYSNIFNLISLNFYVEICHVRYVISGLHLNIVQT